MEAKNMLTTAIAYKHVELINMTIINNVSHESGNKTTTSIHVVNLFPFYTKTKTSILLKVGIEKPAQKNLTSSVFFFNFFRYLKAFYINYTNINSITKHITL